VPVAKKVEGLAHKKVFKVACGSMHTIVCTEDKKLFTFGAGEFGECGGGDQKNKLVPTLIDIQKPKKKPTGDP
jgi:alpha-tubulin suppressor-like RCC1 family protein